MPSDLAGSLWVDSLWIGGSPCSGKSTIAAQLAATRGRPLYSCDDAFEGHALAADLDDGPTLKKVVALSVADRIAQPLDVQVADVIRLYHEQFPMILRDLGEFQEAPVVEGAALLPELLADLPIVTDRAVWLVPTADFQRRHYARRSWAWALLQETPDPAEAFERWMERDAVFAALVAEQARDLGYRVITVDGTRTWVEIAAEVAGAFSREPA